MKRRWMVWILGAAFLGVLGCGTLGSRGVPASPPPQQLNEEEKGRISHYKELKEGLLVDELQAPQQGRQTLQFYNERMTYEGVLLLRYLGLRDTLNEEASERFIKALFENIPVENPDGAPIRNIVIPRWYKNGFPLILQVTTVFIQGKTRKFPAIVVLMNASDIILDRLGYELARQKDPQYPYPRFMTKDNHTMVEADGTYIFAVQGNMLVSSSLRTSGELPSFESAKSPRAKLNLTDSYLRDENPKNDSVVLPVLKEIYEDKKSEPLDHLHARIQLFLYYFYQQDRESAEKIAGELQASPLLENSEISQREIKSIIKEDLTFILRMNGGLSR